MNLCSDNKFSWSKSSDNRHVHNAGKQTMTFAQCFVFFGCVLKPLFHLKININTFCHCTK